MALGSSTAAIYINICNIHDGLIYVYISVLSRAWRQGAGISFSLESGEVDTCPLSEKYRQAYSINFLTKSSDFKPIENLWRISKHYIIRRVEGQPQSVDEM